MSALRKHRTIHNWYFGG